MKIFTVGFAFLFLWPTAVSRFCLPAMAGHGWVFERIHAEEKPFNNMEIESAYELPVKTIQAKESYQGGKWTELSSPMVSSKSAMAKAKTNWHVSNAMTGRTVTTWWIWKIRKSILITAISYADNVIFARSVTGWAGPTVNECLTGPAKGW
jgi:hypothetical protein